MVLSFLRDASAQALVISTVANTYKRDESRSPNVVKHPFYHKYNFFYEYVFGTELNSV